MSGWGLVKWDRRRRPIQESVAHWMLFATMSYANQRLIQKLWRSNTEWRHQASMNELAVDKAWGMLRLAPLVCVCLYVWQTFMCRSWERETWHSTTWQSSGRRTLPGQHPVCVDYHQLACVDQEYTKSVECKILIALLYNKHDSERAACGHLMFPQ